MLWKSHSPQQVICCDSLCEASILLLLCIGCVVLQDREYRQLWGRVNSETGHLDLLDDTQEVCIPQKDPSKDAVEDDGGLFSVDILDPSLYVPLHVVYYFHNLIWFLKKHKYEPAKTLFGFGYDFRQSNMSHMDALVARLEAASAAKGGMKCGHLLLARSALLTFLSAAEFCCNRTRCITSRGRYLKRVTVCSVACYVSLSAVCPAWQPVCDLVGDHADGESADMYCRKILRM